MDVYIDPRSCINYSSYYILGLYRFLGKSKVHFSARYFGELEQIDMLLAFVTREEGQPSKRYIIDYRDQTDIIGQAYEWSEIYAKINFHKTETKTPDQGGKIFVIPPSFAVRIWNPVETLLLICSNFLKARIYRYHNSPNIHLRPLRWIRNYLTLLRRNRIETYHNLPNTTEKEREKYVFFLSTLWEKNHECNSNREQYIKACTEEPQITFEGGFYILPNTKEAHNLPAHFLFHHYLPNDIYMEKTRRSCIVFNTPAVLHCHGWKLAEYLCMGKAIISTPLSNELPAPLEHKKHLYIVHTEEELKKAVHLLITDDALRHELEHNALDYYKQNMTPEGVVQKLLSV